MLDTRRSSRGRRFLWVAGLTGALAMLPVLFSACDEAPRIDDRETFCSQIEQGGVGVGGRTIVSVVAGVTIDGRFRPFDQTKVIIDVAGGLETEPALDL